jgi:LAGLIDADG DNA endonuclease family protein
MTYYLDKKLYHLTGKEFKTPKPDKKFMSMFMGFVDGDGYIEIGPQKQYTKSDNIAKSTIRARLVIRLHSRDQYFLTYLTQVLGVGSISSLDSTNQTRLIFSKKDLTTVILPLIKQYGLQFLTANRSNQFALLNYIIDNNIVHWDDVNFTSSFSGFSVKDLLNFNFFAN